MLFPQMLCAQCGAEVPVRSEEKPGGIDVITGPCPRQMDQVYPHDSDDLWGLFIRADLAPVEESDEGA